MKKKMIFTVLVFASLTFCKRLLASDIPFTAEATQYLSHVNILKNPGFENGVQRWSASGGTLSSVTTTSNVGSGKKSASWDSNAQNQTFSSVLVPIPSGDYGANYEVSANLKCSSGVCTHLLQAHDGTNVVVSQSITSSTTFTKTTINFPAPTSGALRLMIVSVSANEPELFIDDVYLGRARNVGTVSQAEFVGTVKITGCSTYWTTTSGTFSDFSASSGCVYTIDANGVQQPATNLPGFRISGPPGRYTVLAAGLFDIQGVDAGCNTRLVSSSVVSPEEVYYGTTVGDGTSVITYSIRADQPLNNDSFRIQVRRSSGSGTCAISGITGYPLTFQIYRYPLQSEIAYRPETQQNFASIKFPISSGCSWTIGTSYVDFSPVAACTTPSGANLFGKAEAPTTKVPHMVVKNMNPGTYYVSANITRADVTSANAVSCRIIDSFGNIIAVSSTYNNSTYVSNNGQFGGFVRYDSMQPEVTYKLQCVTTGGSALLRNDSSFFVSGVTHGVEISMIPVSQSLPAPNLVGSITSYSSGSMRLEYVEFGSPSGTQCTSSPCTILRSSSDWIVQVIRTGLGDYQFDIKSGIFNGRPTCFGSSHSAYWVGVGRNASDTNYSVVVRGNFTGYAAFDDAPRILCIGVRGSL